MTNSHTAIHEFAEFDAHHLVSTIYSGDNSFVAFIAIHRGGRVPSFGATRIWRYETSQDALRDALHLSRIMSYKAALAGLPYGGAKGVIFPLTDKVPREKILQEYARRVNIYNGFFITGADVGVDQNDVRIMQKESASIVGSKVDPVYFTGVGLWYGVLECLRDVFGTDSISDRTFSIQGLGKTGMALLSYIYEDAKAIYVSDISESKIAEARAQYPRIQVIGPRQIYTRPVDVFVPCALSNAITRTNVKFLQCKIIVGSANGQLEHESVGDELFQKGILYAPDYVVNAGGLISVAHEYRFGNGNKIEIAKEVSEISKTMHMILEMSRKEKKAPFRIADAIGVERLAKIS